MNRVAVLLFVALVAIATYAIVASAQPGVMGGGRGEPMMESPEAVALEPLEEESDIMRGRRGAMMGQAAIAVSGNHIFVIAGDLLLKYDQDLNLVKQAELPVPEMGPGRGMGRGGRGGGGRGGGGRGMRRGEGW
ncbi:MAG TPA: hypothetical protein VMY87_10255 [Armatimonadota bacterium]|nr:hypothetical protein [Armatimonadota bacterium]